jgi:hypothetical protein
MAWTLDDASTIRQMIAHEDDLINHRLTWLAQLQGFLFAALGFAWEKDRVLVPGLVVVGIVTALSVHAACLFSGKAVNGLREEWEKNKPTAPDAYNGPDVIGYCAEKEKKSLVRFLGRFLPWKVLPLFFALAWIWIMWRFCQSPVGADSLGGFWFP